jgi:hypothetical protein
MRHRPRAVNLFAGTVALRKAAGLPEAVRGLYGNWLLDCKAHHMGLRRRFLGDCDVPIDGHMELIDQIRIRAKQDGVPLCKIDDVLKTRHCFTRNWKKQRRGEPKGGRPGDRVFRRHARHRLA